MTRILLVGSESSHCDAYLAAFNREQRHPPMRITHILGEEVGRTRQLAETFFIETIVEDLSSALPHVDAAIVAHRRGSDHVAPAQVLLRRGIPTFIDKPMAGSWEGAMALHALAREVGTPVDSFSVVPLQQSVCAAREGVRPLMGVEHVTITGPCDPQCPWEGLRFYGIHLVETLLDFLPGEPAGIVARPGASPDGALTFLFHDGLGREMASMITRPDYATPLHLSILAEGRRFDFPLPFDKDLYAVGIAAIARFFQTGIPHATPGRILACHGILDAMQAALLRPETKIPIGR